MQIKAQEIRHIALLFMIVSIVPLIFFPGNLGLTFEFSMALYVLLELLYFGTITYIFLDGPSPKATLTSAILGLGFRIAAGLFFGLLLVLMNGVDLGPAIGAGLYGYKPAVLLQTLTTPFILMSLFRLIVASETSAEGRFTITSLAKEDPGPSEQYSRSLPNISHSVPEPVIIGAPADVVPLKKAAHDFDGALNHIFELSAVKFCVLFDEEGLPVGFSGNDYEIRDCWSSVGRLIVDQIQNSVAKVGDFVLDGFHLELDSYRIHLTGVCEMWLLVGADRHSEELEKVRIGQAVEMIRRLYNQKYVDSEPIQVPEESHV